VAPYLECSFLPASSALMRPASGHSALPTSCNTLQAPLQFCPPDPSKNISALIQEPTKQKFRLGSRAPGSIPGVTRGNHPSTLHEDPEDAGRSERGNPEVLRSDSHRDLGRWHPRCSAQAIHIVMQDKEPTGICGPGTLCRRWRRPLRSSSVWTIPTLSPQPASPGLLDPMSAFGCSHRNFRTSDPPPALTIAQSHEKGDCDKEKLRGKDTSPQLEAGVTHREVAAPEPS
jgi:hypothetical protein